MDYKAGKSAKKASAMDKMIEKFAPFEILTADAAALPGLPVVLYMHLSEKA